MVALVDDSTCSRSWVKFCSAWSRLFEVVCIQSQAIVKNRYFYVTGNVGDWCQLPSENICDLLFDCRMRSSSLFARFLQMALLIRWVSSSIDIVASRHHNDHHKPLRILQFVPSSSPRRRHRHSKMADWANEASTFNSTFSRTDVGSGGGGPGGGSTDDLANRTANISAHLKKIYRKSVLPVEKRYKYDYFYESPLLTDIEFDGKLLRCVFELLIRIFDWIEFCGKFLIHVFKLLIGMFDHIEFSGKLLIGFHSGC